MAFETIGALSASTKGTDIGADDDAKGTWVEIASSIGIDAKFAHVISRYDGISTSPSGLIDIGTGTSGSEVVLMPDIFFESGPSFDDRMAHWNYPSVDIASGTRIVGRAEAEEAGGFVVYEIIIILADTAIRELTSPTFVTYGITSGSAGSKGTQVDPGATANTKGSWVELTSSFSATGEIVSFSIGDDRNSALTDAQWLVDIGIGSEGSEAVVIGDFLLGADATCDAILPTVVGPFPAADLQGERVSARAQCTLTNATDRLFRIAAHVTEGTPVSGGGGGSVQLVNSNSLVS